MKKFFLPISVVAAGLLLSGCSAMYRTSQTPDDVYYSTGPAAQDERQVNRNTARNNQPQPDNYSSYWEGEDDDYLRMKVRDRSRWGSIDDLDYWHGYNNNYWVNYNTFNSPFGMGMFGNQMAMNSWNSPFGMNRWGMSPWGFNSGFGMNQGFGWNSGFGMNNGFGWNSGFGYNSMNFGWNSWNNNWNNPWSWNRPVVIINKYPTGTMMAPQSRASSGLGAYRNNQFDRNVNPGLRSNARPATNQSIWESSGSNQNRNANSNMYRTINRNNSSGNNSYDRPTRTFEPSSSSPVNSGGSSRSSGSSGGSSGGSSSGGSSRGGRGG